MNKIYFSNNIFFDHDIKKNKKNLYKKKTYEKNYSFFFQLKFVEKVLMNYQK